MMMDDTKAAACDGLKPLFAIVAIQLGFAMVNIFLKKTAEGGANSLVLITYRLIICSIPLCPIAFFCERKSRPKLTFSILCYLFVNGILGITLVQYFFLTGIHYTTATFASAFYNMVPMITFLMALPFRMETIDMKSNSGKAKVIGMLVSLGGAMMLTLYRGVPLFHISHHSQAAAMAEGHAVRQGSVGRQNWAIGSVSLCIATLLWCSWFLLQSKVGKMYPCPYSATAIMTIFGAIQSASLWFFTERNYSMWVFKSKFEIITVLYTGLVASGLCYVGLLWCLKKRGPVYTTAFSPLIQIMTTILAILFLHEELHLGSLLGSTIVIIGLYILLWGKNRESKNYATQVAEEQPTSA